MKKMMMTASVAQKRTPAFMPLNVGKNAKPGAEAGGIRLP